MDIAAGYWQVRKPEAARFIGGALLLLAGAGLVIVIQRGEPARAPAHGSNAAPGSTVPAIRGLNPDIFAGSAGASRLPAASLPGSIDPNRLSLRARIAFMSVSGNGDIYEMDADGSRKNARVSDPGHDCGPAYSPDGRSMMFSSERSSGFSSSSSVALGPTALPWYPLNFDLYLLDLGTGEQHQVTTNPGIDFTPSWSPDGRRIAFGSGPLGGLTSIWVMNVDGSGLRRITQSHGSTFHWIPDWSPDGTRIAYMSSDLADLAHPSLHVVEADGSDDRVLVDDGGFPAWSPDGRLIAFASSRGQLPGQYDLYLMDPDGSHQRRIGHQEGAEFAPSWSPDGHDIAYVQDPDGWIFEGFVLLPDGRHTLNVQLGGPESSSIWRMDADGSNRLRLTPLGGGDLWPTYAPAPNA